METVQFCILALSAGSLVLGIVVFLKLRSVVYMLEQPVVKKMSPALKLKPVKVDEIDTQSSRTEARPANSANGNRGPRPNFERPEGGERQNRDSQPRHERGPRPEGNSERGGGERGPRPDRGDRNFRDRDRGPRTDRHGAAGGREPMGNRDAAAGPREGGDRHGGADRNRNRSESFSNAAETPASESAPMASRPAPVPAQDHSQGGPALAPRRPLPSTVDQDHSGKEFTPPEPVSADVAADAMFMRDDSDIQHGRRNQLKKKPRFDVSEEDVKTATTEESKA